MKSTEFLEIFFFNYQLTCITALFIIHILHGNIYIERRIETHCQSEDRTRDHRDTSHAIYSLSYCITKKT